MNDPVVLLMFVLFGLALVGIALAFGTSSPSVPPRSRRRVFQVHNIPVGTYRKVVDSSQLPALPWPRSWFCTSKWPEGWWVVIGPSSYGGPLTPKKFGDRWDPRFSRWLA